MWNAGQVSKLNDPLHFEKRTLQQAVEKWSGARRTIFGTRPKGGVSERTRGQILRSEVGH
jgi:hypothetical protein